MCENYSAQCIISWLQWSGAKEAMDAGGELPSATDCIQLCTLAVLYFIFNIVHSILYFLYCIFNIVRSTGWFF